MTLGTAALLFVLSVAGLFISARALRERKRLRTACIVLFAFLALALAAYIGLTALFLFAAGHQPPTP